MNHKFRGSRAEVQECSEGAAARQRAAKCSGKHHPTAPVATLKSGLAVADLFCWQPTPRFAPASARTLNQREGTKIADVPPDSQGGHCAPRSPFPATLMSSACSLAPRRSWPNRTEKCIGAI